jgi:hypothetical protein
MGQGAWMRSGWGCLLGDVAWCGMGLHGVVWRSVVWHGVASGLEWNGVERSGSARWRSNVALGFVGPSGSPESVSEGFSFSRSSAGVGWRGCIGPEN